MANLKLEFKPRALKDLRKAPKLDQERILSKIELLASGPGRRRQEANRASLRNTGFESARGAFSSSVSKSESSSTASSVATKPIREPEEDDMTLHPQILEKDGRKQFVILPYEEFERIQEALEDLEDLQTLREAKVTEAEAPTLTLARAREELGRD